MTTEPSLHLINEFDRLLKAIATRSRQIEYAIEQAFSLTDLMRSRIRDAESSARLDEAVSDTLRHIRQAVETGIQEEIERAEKAVDEGALKPPRDTMFFGGGEVKPDPSRPIAKHGEFDPQPRLIIGISEGQLGAFVRGDDGAMRPMAGTVDKATPGPVPPPAWADLTAEQQEAAQPLLDGIASMIPPVALELDEAAFLRDEEATNSPLAAEENDTGAADELSPQPPEAAPVDQSVASESLTIPAGDEAAAPPAGASIIGMDFGTEDSVVVSVTTDAPPAAAEEPRSLRDIVETVQRRAAGEPVDAAERQKANASEVDSLYEGALTLWATTLLTEAQIGKRLGVTKALVMTVLEQARADGDDRADRSKKHKPKPATAPKEAEPMPAKGQSSSPPWKPFVAQTGVDHGEFVPPSSAKHISRGICVVDLEANRIYGKRGMWTTSPEVARTVAKLNQGQMFSQDVIQKDCAWPTIDHLRRGVTPMIERLRDIGVELVNLPVGLKLNVLD